MTTAQLERIVVVGTLNVDQLWQVPTLPRPEQTLLATKIHRLWGGKGANEAVASARQGASVALVGRALRPAGSPVTFSNEPMNFFAARTLLTFAFFLPFIGRTQNEPTEIRPTVSADMLQAGGTFFGQKPDPRRTRQYYIAAESELWDYLPSGRDEMCGKPLPPPLVANRRAGKLRYIQYTDATFTTKMFPNPRLGILGPVLRGVVGDFLAVTFLNRTSQSLSMHPHGVKYDKDSEGSYYQPGPGKGAAVGPGAKFTYIWQLDESSGPLPTEPSSKGWLYHSHVTGDEETNLGLIGTIIVTDKLRARPDGTPNDVDREMATLFMLFDESGLGEAEKEAAEYANLPGAQSAALTWEQVQQAIEQGTRASINGYVFGSLPGLEINEGERTRWYLFALGSEMDLHTAHWHGLRVVEEGRRRTDVVELLPASMKIADLVADNPGTWMFHCHVADHMREGMFSRLVVYPRDTVGVDRAPETAFLGLPRKDASLRIDAFEIVRTSPQSGARQHEIRLTGAATVFEAFSVFNQSIRVQMGGVTATFAPNQAGIARTPQGTWQIKNASEFGVISGGVMHFDLTLTGEEWLGAIETALAASATKKPAGGARMPVAIEIGQAHHVTDVKVRSR